VRYWHMSKTMSVEECSYPAFGTSVRIRPNHYFCNALLKKRLRKL
jgi:hypothetical protein